MALHGSQSKAMSLNLSSDAKPRLKWTPELHQRFVDSVNQLGGAEKATPKSLMRLMGIHGLTLYHLKSHLQKYRLGRNHQSKPYHQNKQQVSDAEGESFFTSKECDEEAQEPHEQVNERTEIAEALQLQMEVQRKLHEQIEVQRHLQLRIEAQGKYLQSVLKKAQETLSGYGSCSIEVERAKAQLSQLMSMVDSGCPSSSFSVLTESDGSMLRDTTNKLLGHNRCSLESSLTSSECSGMKEELTPTHEVDNKSVVLSLMEMHPSEKSGAENNSRNRKRSRSTDDDDDDDLKLDLNSKYLNEFDSNPRMIDLNCKIAEQ